MKHTELELTRMSSAKLLAILHKHNPLGGYSIGYRKGQLARNQAIATILRYEQTDDEKTQAAYRKQTGETGRSVPQYSDQAGSE